VVGRLRRRRNPPIGAARTGGLRFANPPREPGDPRADPEFRALLALSARLGRDPLRTQAAGGNTSLKRDGVLWIKASGTWLAEAEARDIMVPVALAPLLDALARGDTRAEKATAFVLDPMNPSGLRPSVETSVHAVIPRAVVVHIHCVATVALAVRTDAEPAIAERLEPVSGVDWLFVPYAKPGVTLSRAIAAGLRPSTNVVVLGNHGLIVAADTVAAADGLVQRVCNALAADPRVAPSADAEHLARLAEGSPYRLPTDPAAHGVAMDPGSLAIARLGSLYPDHVVFLGRGITLLADGASLAEVAVRAPPLMLVLPGKGVLLHRAAVRGADELARGLADVTARIPADASIRCLSRAQEDELIDWDAEIYRLSLAAR
jgi:rhamnose utilization protein RhaD (predicted bifunctional aldolase and dehydrogenase)